MRQRASLDIIADERSGEAAGPRGDKEGEVESFAESANHLREESRSTSWSSSPPPADNDESDFFVAVNDSQSSLGVPNFENMQAAENKSLPPVNRLPNELLISVFTKLSSSSDVLHVMLTCTRWARNAVDILWHRPACTSWEKHASICQTIGNRYSYFPYRDFVKRLNLASLAVKVNDGSLLPLATCKRVERLTLTGCKFLTDSALIALLQDNDQLLAIDISYNTQITDQSIDVLAGNCSRLQGLNITACTKIAPQSLINLAQNCRCLKRLKLNECRQLTDEAIMAFAENCSSLLEIDLQQCRLIGNDPVTALLSLICTLRELRLAGCELIDDGAFLSLPHYYIYEQLRILDLSSCVKLTDRAVDKIIDVAPRLRNIVFSKCRNLTDAAVDSISRLGKNLHFLHLGHCGHLTDDAIKRLVGSCTRLRYVDLGCCVHLTDASVIKLAGLPKLKRIGLVKCSNITDRSVYALATANLKVRHRRDADGNIYEERFSSHSCLERVHLSYCTSLTLKSITKLLNACPRLTHLSLTGVQAFLRDDLDQFCRDAPPEFTEHQRQVFCVFSGPGVHGLRQYLRHQAADLALGQEEAEARARGGGGAGHGFILPPPPPLGHNPDVSFDDGDGDAADEDDTLEDGTEMVIDTQPLLSGSDHVTDHSGPALPTPTTNPFGYVSGHPPYVPHLVQSSDNHQEHADVLPRLSVSDEDYADLMDVSPAGPSTASGPSNDSAGVSATTASLDAHHSLSPVMSHQTSQPSSSNMDTMPPPVPHSVSPSTGRETSTPPRYEH